MDRLRRLFAQAEVNCAEVRQRSSEYLEGDLTPSRLQRFRAHLAGCEPCQNFIDSLASVVNMLAGLGRVQSPPTLKQSIMQRIERSGRNE